MVKASTQWPHSIELRPIVGRWQYWRLGSKRQQLSKVSKEKEVKLKQGTLVGDGVPRARNGSNSTGAKTSEMLRWRDCSKQLQNCDKGDASVNAKEETLHCMKQRDTDIVARCSERVAK